MVSVFCRELVSPIIIHLIRTSDNDSLDRMISEYGEFTVACISRCLLEPCAA